MCCPLARWTVACDSRPEKATMRDRWTCTFAARMVSQKCAWLAIPPDDAQSTALHELDGSYDVEKSPTHAPDAAFPSCRATDTVQAPPTHDRLPSILDGQRRVLGGYCGRDCGDGGLPARDAMCVGLVWYLGSLFGRNTRRDSTFRQVGCSRLCRWRRLFPSVVWTGEVPSRLVQSRLGQ